jgi:hypothetical protein
MNYCGTALQFQSLANPTNGLPTAGTIAKGTVMTTTTPLDLNQGFFDSTETEILSMAFQKAWAFVEFDPMLGGLEASAKRSQLARCLMTLFKLGETDPTSLANSAIKCCVGTDKAVCRNVGR